MENENLSEKDKVSSPTAEETDGTEVDEVDPQREVQGDLPSLNSNDENHNIDHDKLGEAMDDQTISSIDGEKHNLQHEEVVESPGDGDKVDPQGEDPEELPSSNSNDKKCDVNHDKMGESSDNQTISDINEESCNLRHEKVERLDDQKTTLALELEPEDVQTLNIDEENHSLHPGEVGERSDSQTIDTLGAKPENQEETYRCMEDNVEENVVDPVFDGTETLDVEDTASSSTRSLDLDPECQGSPWSEKAVSLKQFVKEKSTVAVSTVLRRLSGKKDEDDQNLLEGQEKNDNSITIVKDDGDSTPNSKSKEASQKKVERSLWNPLNYVRIARDVDSENAVDQGEVVCTEIPAQTPVLKGRIILYTRLGCQECRQVRTFMLLRRLRYVEINIDVYPGRKLELERYTGSPAVPMIFFNEHPIGGLGKLKEMEESGELKDKINDLMSEEPSTTAPLPPLSGEDDESCSGPVDELATIAKKMRHSILVKDRFCRMRRYNNCFLGSEAVDFLVEDQELQREQAVEFGKKLASKQFFRHILDENVFEDGNHLYRFLDHDPVVMSQCYNIPRGIIEAKPKSLMEISSRLRFLSIAIFEAYTSVDGKHVDYRSIHGSEEFARYLRVVEELQRVEMLDLSREEKLAFFINLFNMMAIHAILTWGYPTGTLERRRMLGDFKYVIGGCTYSLSAIQNGILRGNQRPPYNLIKPFGVKDPRAKIALPYSEPLVHFALVIGTRSGPPLRCYSPGNIDKELMEAARNFLRNGGIIVNPEAKVASVTKILRWFSVDFGKNEVEVIKHAANYLDPEKTEELLELLATTQLKVVYQPYDWGLNY